MALHPVGPLPASIYWRRRAVLLLVVVVLLLVARSCATGGSPASRSKGKTPVTHTPSPSSSATTPPVATGGACADSDLTLQASTEQANYPVGGKPKLTVTVGNTSAASCTRDLGPGAIEFLVFSGSDRVWSSDDCGGGKESSIVTLAPGARKALSLPWSGKRSKPGCGGSREQAKAGTYRLTVRVGTARSDGAVFHFQG